MKRYKVAIQPRVHRQIFEQVCFIADDSLDIALAWEKRLLDVIESLADSPGYGIDEDASNRLRIIVRRLVFEANYLVHFTVDEAKSTIDVIGFRHTARLPRKGEP